MREYMAKSIRQYFFKVSNTSLPFFFFSMCSRFFSPMGFDYTNIYFAVRRFGKIFIYRKKRKVMPRTGAGGFLLYTGEKMEAKFCKKSENAPLSTIFFFRKSLFRTGSSTFLFLSFFEFPDYCENQYALIPS